MPVWIENSRRVMPKGELLPVPLLCTLSRRRADQARSRTRTSDAFVERTRNALLALMPPEA